MASEQKQETKKCPRCDMDISVKAQMCPHCRKDLRSWPNRHPILTILGVIIIALTMAGLAPQNKINKREASPTPTPLSKKETFNAAVNFTGTQFVIGNQDQYACINARMEINGGLLKGGYVLEGDTLEAGQEYTVGAGQFVKDDGTRFNPFGTKPQNFNINCRGNNELSSAFWYGEFK